MEDKFTNTVADAATFERRRGGYGSDSPVNWEDEMEHQAEEAAYWRRQEAYYRERARKRKQTDDEEG